MIISFRDWLIIKGFSESPPIKCPSILTERAHNSFMDLLENTSPQVVENLDYAHKKLEKIMRSRMTRLVFQIKFSIVKLYFALNF